MKLLNLADIPFEPKKPEAIDSSMLGDYVACPWKFYTRHVLGLAKKGDKRIALDYGSFWHMMMELRDRESEQAAMEYWEENKDLLPTVEPQKNRTQARILADFLDYCAEREPIENEATVAVEQMFDLRLPNTGFRWSGKLDKLFRIGSDFRILDYKTTTFFHKWYFDSHEMGFQVKGYVWAARQLMPAHNIDKAILDVYHIKKGDTAFYRRPFYYTAEQIEEWVFEVEGWLTEIHHLLDNHLHEPEMWRRNYKSCSDFGGCPFRQVCNQNPARKNRARLLTADYEVSRWDPIAQEEKKESND